MLVFVALLALPAMILTACIDELVDEDVDENVVVVEESDMVVADEIEEPSVEEAVEAREEGEPPGETFETVEPVGEPVVEGIEEQVEEQIGALGETMTLSGTVTEMLGERTFVFAPSSDADPLLVIVVSDETSSPDLGGESTVTVTGALAAAFYIEDVEKVTGLDLDDDLLDDYQGAPALVATSVAVSD
jgi:hypothetical protein